MGLLCSHVLHQHLFPSPHLLILRWVGFSYLRTLAHCVSSGLPEFIFTRFPKGLISCSLKGRKNWPDRDQTRACGFITKHANHCTAEVNKDGFKFSQARDEWSLLPEDCKLPCNLHCCKALLLFQQFLEVIFHSLATSNWSFNISTCFLCSLFIQLLWVQRSTLLYHGEYSQFCSPAIPTGFVFECVSLWSLLINRTACLWVTEN